MESLPRESATGSSNIESRKTGKKPVQQLQHPLNSMNLEACAGVFTFRLWPRRRQLWFHCPCLDTLINHAQSG